MHESSLTLPSSHAAVTLNMATAVTRRYIDPALTVTAVRKLYGGSINQVLDWQTTGHLGHPTGHPGHRGHPEQPASIVAKLHATADTKTFQRERDSLNFYLQHTHLPVPKPYACFQDDPDIPGSGLLMEKIPGVTLADARLSPDGFAAIQRDLARHVVSLHQHTRATYGPATSDHGSKIWLDIFAPMLEKELYAVRDSLSSLARHVADHVLHHLPAYLPEHGQPVLTHGDLWATNILVDDRHPARPRITAFVDGNAAYCDAEYELAYLRLFHTADDTFFQTYQQTRPLLTGFDRRCRVYWLNTMLMHVRMFGERYLPSCEDVARQLRRA